MIILKNKNNTVQGINLFFIEIIVLLLFFGISGAIVLKAFACADSKAKLSIIYDKASLCSQSIAEIYRDNNKETAFAMVFGENYTDYLNGSTLLMDGECNLSESGAVTLKFSEETTESECGKLHTLTLVFDSSEKEIYSFSCCSYIPTGGGQIE